jgi:hypothetical protein
MNRQHNADQREYSCHHKVALLETAECQSHPENEQYSGNGNRHDASLLSFLLL